MHTPETLTLDANRPALNPQAGEPIPGEFRGVGLWIAATRPAFLTVTLLGSLIGLATAYFDGYTIDPVKALLTIFFALVAHAGVNVINDFHDAENGTDDANTERLFPFTGGSRFIQNRVLSAKATGWFGYALLASIIPPGIWLTIHSSPGLFVIGVAGLFVGWAYSAPPFKLMSRGLGEVAIVIGWLLVCIGTDFVQRGSFAGLPALVGLPFALLVASILYINQFPDRKADELVGKRTVVVRWGTENARWGYLTLILLANLWILLLVGRNTLPLLTALAVFVLPLSMQAGRQLLQFADQPSQLRKAITQTIAACHLHGLLLIAGLLLARHGF